MGTITKFNRFPTGNLGGLVASEILKGSVSVFLPPMEGQEVSLNVQDLPNKAKVSTGTLMPVLTQQHGNNASGWRLRIATRDSMGKNVWSAFTYANVYNDARICWGSGNHAPRSFVSAWMDFWNAPFNRDLSNDITIDTYPDWVNKNRHLLPDKKDSIHDRIRSLADKNDQETLRRHGPFIDVNNWPRGTVVETKLSEKRQRRAVVRERLLIAKDHMRNRNSLDCAERGVKWLAVNHKPYLKLCRAIEKAESHYSFADSMLSELYAARDAMYRSVETWVGEFGPRFMMWMTAHDCFVRSGGRNTGDHNWYRDNLAESSARFRKACRGATPGMIRKYMRNRLCRFLTMQANQIEESKYAMEYREYTMNATRGGRIDHFVRDGWIKTLSFVNIDADLEPWGKVIAFPPCDGLISFPVCHIESEIPVFKNLFNSKYPHWQEGFIYYTPEGHAYTCTVKTRWAFFRKITDRVVFVFRPDSDETYLTDGYYIEPVNDETFAAALAKIEESSPVDINPREVLTRIGYFLELNSAYSHKLKKRKVKADGAAGEPVDEQRQHDLDRLAVLRNLTEPDDCECAVCQNVCGCRPCYEQTDEYVDDEGQTHPACQCAACEWIGSHGTTIRSFEAHGNN